MVDLFLFCLIILILLIGCWQDLYHDNQVSPLIWLPGLLIIPAWIYQPFSYSPYLLLYLVIMFLVGIPEKIRAIIGGADYLALVLVPFFLPGVPLALFLFFTGLYIAGFYAGWPENKPIPGFLPITAGTIMCFSVSLL